MFCESRGWLYMVPYHMPRIWQNWAGLFSVSWTHPAYLHFVSLLKVFPLSGMYFSLSTQSFLSWNAGLMSHFLQKGLPDHFSPQRPFSSLAVIVLLSLLCILLILSVQLCVPSQIFPLHWSYLSKWIISTILSCFWSGLDLLSHFRVKWIWLCSFSDTDNASGHSKQYLRVN